MSGLDQDTDTGDDEPQAAQCEARASASDVVGSGSRIRSGLRQARRHLSAVLSHLDRLRLEYVYLAIAVPWGLALLVMMPPLQVPDEPAHLYRAWGLAQGRFLPPRDFIESVPSNVHSLQQSLPVRSIGDPTPYPDYPWNRIGPLLSESISKEHVTIATGVPSQNPVAYAPQALGVLVAKLTGFSPLGGFYLARLFNLLTAVALTFLAIRLAPWGRVMLLLVALLPVTISEMASVSPDALMMSGAFLFTGMCLHLAREDNLRTRQLLALLLVGVLLLTVKPSYFPIVGLVLMIPRSSFGSPRRHLAWTAGIVAAVVAVSVIGALMTPVASNDLPGPARGPVQAGADPVSQAKHVLSDPASFAQVLVNTFRNEGFTQAYNMVGLLSWLSIQVSAVAVLLIAGLTILFLPGFPGDPPVPRLERAVLLSVGMLTVICVCLFVYLAMAPVGGSSVPTLQGRYFTPAMPLLLLGAYRIRWQRKWFALVLIFAVFVLVAVTTMRAVWYHFP